MQNTRNHSSERNYDHLHMHDHDYDIEHTRDHAESPVTAEKDLALLKYMLEHNKQHARELSEISARLLNSGFARSAESIGEAVDYFDNASAKLEQAIGAMDMNVEE